MQRKPSLILEKWSGMILSWERVEKFAPCMQETCIWIHNKHVKQACQEHISEESDVQMNIKLYLMATRFQRHIGTWTAWGEKNWTGAMKDDYFLRNCCLQTDSHLFFQVKLSKYQMAEQLWISYQWNAILWLVGCKCALIGLVTSLTAHLLNSMHILHIFSFLHQQQDYYLLPNHNLFEALCNHDPLRRISRTMQNTKENTIKENCVWICWTYLMLRP